MELLRPHCVAGVLDGPCMSWGNDPFPSSGAITRLVSGRRRRGKMVSPPPSESRLQKKGEVNNVLSPSPLAQLKRFAY